MCSAPNSACAWRRSAGLRKSKSSWHIHRLTKDADFGLWSKNALMCIAPMRKHLFGARFPSSPWGLTAIAFTTQALEQLQNVLLVPHSPSPLYLNERHRKEWRKKFLFPTFGLCQRASPLGHLRAQCVPTGKNEGSVVSPPISKVCSCRNNSTPWEMTTLGHVWAPLRHDEMLPGLLLRAEDAAGCDLAGCRLAASLGMRGPLLSWGSELFLPRNVREHFICEWSLS